MTNELYTKLAESIGNPDSVLCHECGRVEKVDAAKCFAHGWPTCCGATMGLASRPAAERDTHRP